MVKIFVNSQEVTKEDLSKIEIQSREIKKILLENLLIDRTAEIPERQ